MFNRSSILLCFFVFAGFAFENNHNYYVIEGTHEDNSVIKLWYTVLGLLDDYDKGNCSGFEVSFHNNGKHFDPDWGTNWWSYYFAFNAVGSSESCPILRVPRYRRSIIRFITVCTMEPERGNFLLTKYMHLQPWLQAKLDQIKQHYWPRNTPVIGVYYQKPIMPDAQKSWNAFELCNRVKTELRAIGDCKICLFTDLEGFSTVFEEQFGSQFMHIPCLMNGKGTKNAERGEHELLTLLLLAQCELVIAPGSYQATGAKMLNPKLQLIELDTIPYARK